MRRLNASDLLHEISRLDMGRVYEYVSGNSRLMIRHIQKPEGPIQFVNLNPDGSTRRTGSISRQQLAKMALVCSSKPNYPLHIDRVFSAGGNSRSALETLLAYTQHFFTCYPERMDAYSRERLKNLKHIMWCPDEQHPKEQIAIKDYTDLITEVELEVNFGNVHLTSANLGTEFETIEAKRTHTQMPIALIQIGRALNFMTWIARNDRSIVVENTTLGSLEGVVQSLDDIKILYDAEIKRAASLIDCIWFTADAKRIPAVIEIEHSTGVTSGLTRMLKLREAMPAIQTNFAIVAPNALRNKVVSEANQEILSDLRARFMPYSTVQELYGLIQRYPLAGFVDYRFVEPFMAQVVED